MTPFDVIRSAAGRLPSPLNGAVELGAYTAADWASLLTGPLSDGDDLDAWDPEYIERTLPILSKALDVYFRPEVRGLENIPAEGPVLLVGNHSGGTLIADTFAFAYAFYKHFGTERRFHQLAHDLAARLAPLRGLRRYGVLAASHENAAKALQAGAAVLVYPGGDYESFRPTSESAQVDFGGRSGWVRLALREGVPIVPVAAHGGQETALFVTRGERLARLLMLDRLLRIKVFPIQIAPPFGITVLDLPTRIPFPAKIRVQVLPPIDLRERLGANPDVDGAYWVVSGELQKAVDELAAERTIPVVG